jgi:hypothetical protein
LEAAPHPLPNLAVDHRELLSFLLNAQPISTDGATSGGAGPVHSPCSQSLFTAPVQALCCTANSHTCDPSILTTPHRTMPHHAAPCHTMPHHAAPCRTMPHHAAPFHTMLHHATLATPKRASQLTVESHLGSASTSWKAHIAVLRRCRPHRYSRRRVHSAHHTHSCEWFPVNGSFL